MLLWVGDELLKKFLLIFSVFLSFVVVVCALVYGASVTDVEVSLAINKKLPIYSVETDKKQVAISFDCAWGTEHTDEILKNLERYNVKATFFAVEFWVEKYPDYVKKIVSLGHEFGTHSKTHSKMSTLTESQITNELISSTNKIEALTGQKVKLFRPPFGDYNNKLIEVSNSLGLQVIQWDVDSLDWKDLSAQEISFRVINKAKNGSIILCHNNGLHTAESLPLIFADLQNKGYEFLPISQLIYYENYKIDNNGRQSLIR